MQPVKGPDGRETRGVDVFDATASPVQLAGRLVNVLATEQREATYKEAFVLSLLMECAGEAHDQGLSLLGLADRFIDIYWQQLNPYSGGRVLQQSRRGVARIPHEIESLKTAASISTEWRPGKPRTTKKYEKARKRIAQAIAQQPATHLQNPGGTGGARDFLFDSTWLRDKITVKELDAHDWTLRLLPGAREALQLTAPLLVPVVQKMWEDDIRRFNAVLGQERELTRFLFGDDRLSLRPLRLPLRDAQRGRCFYCCRALGKDFHVDHVVPWSRSALNDLANLVAADTQCNQRKSDALPTMEVVRFATTRTYLWDLSVLLGWELDPGRVLGVATALDAATPPGTRLWGKSGHWVEK